MSRLDDLIKSLCPDGVKFRKIKEVCTDINTGLNPRKFFKVNTIDAENYYVTIREMVDGNIIFSDKTDKINDEAMMLCNNRSKLDENTVLFSGTGTIGRIVVLNEAPKNWNIKEGVYALHPIITLIVPKYLGYVLQSSKIVSKYMNYVCGGTVKSIPMRDLKNVEIPVPPLEIQKEIVRLLDDFTAKTAVLQAELNKEYEARKKQYEYYRDTLLNDEEATRKVTLQDVAQYSKARISSSEVDETNYVGVDNLLQNKKGKVNSTHVPTSGNLTEFQSGDILIGNIRPYLQKIWLSDKTGGTNGDVLDIRPNQKLVTPPFLYQVLASDRFFNYDMQNSKGAKMPRGNKEKVMEYSFALPTLERQREIVLLLNKFEIAFNDLQSNISIEL